MAVAVGIGLMEYPFETTKAYWRWVDMCEAGGVDSFWQTDRVVSREPILECMTAIAAVAGRTKRLKFGMNVISLALRDPVLIAKQCATIDVLSEGRLLPAFGVGSPMAPEWKALGIDTKGRGGKTDEGLEIIKRLWREERVDFEGRHYKLSGASISPRPVQADIPMWIGGSSQAAIERTARVGTGWQAGPETPEQAGEVVKAIKAALPKYNRTIDADHYGAGFPFYFGKPDAPVLDKVMASYKKRTGREPLNYFAVGDKDDLVQRIAEYVTNGVEKFVIRPVGRGDDAMLHQTQRLIDEVLPEVARRWPRPAKVRP
ncbi:MAG: LLM class flavin-dependent oxidoreductase [Hyphomicrobiaceae bacterium]